MPDIAAIIRSSGGSDFSSLMLSAACQPVSVIALLCCRFMPLILAEIAVAHHKKVLLNCICLLKAFSYGFTVSLVYLYFQSAGWLNHFLFLFSDTVFCEYIKGVINISVNIKGKVAPFLTVGIGISAEA